MNATVVDQSYQLSWLETQWEELYKDRNPLLVTGVLAFVMHELVYFGRFLPFLICDYLPYFRQYKIQPDKVNTPADIWKCTKQVLFQHFFFEAPLIFFFHPMASMLGMNIAAPFPGW
jgi:methylsterol monooxygenase